MPSLIAASEGTMRLRLARDLVRTIQQGHPWVYRDALRELPQAPPGACAELLSPDGRRTVARGFYDPVSPLAFRVCVAGKGDALDDRWAVRQLERAVALREITVPAGTTGRRLVNGEGDGLPGLVVDQYGGTAVFKCDGAAAGRFWNPSGIAEFLSTRCGIAGAWLRHRDRDAAAGIVWGTPAAEPEFVEHGLQFCADVVQGQKTGFFFDQRENRRMMGAMARGRTVLNLFAYTGGFSAAAGIGGARHVVSVDIARPAIQAAERNWRLNRLPEEGHQTLALDAFEFLANAAAEDRTWDLVIADPPSFAPSARTVPQAREAYARLAAAGAAVAAPQGVLALGSCSSHIEPDDFLSLCLTGVSRARRRGTVLAVTGQPADHPWPLACPELRYLKFVVLALSGGRE